MQKVQGMIDNFKNCPGNIRAAKKLAHQTPLFYQGGGRAASPIPPVVSPLIANRIVPNIDTGSVFREVCRGITSGLKVKLICCCCCGWSLSNTFTTSMATKLLCVSRARFSVINTNLPKLLSNELVKLKVFEDILIQFLSLPVLWLDL